MTDPRFMFDQMKPTCAKYVLQYQNGHSFDDQDLKRSLNLDKDPKFIWPGTISHILGAKYLINWKP